MEVLHPRSAAATTASAVAAPDASALGAAATRTAKGYAARPDYSSEGKLDTSSASLVEIRTVFGP